MTDAQIAHAFGVTEDDLAALSGPNREYLRARMRHLARKLQLGATR